jgi:hypothetical protein
MSKKSPQSGPVRSRKSVAPGHGAPAPRTRFTAVHALAVVLGLAGMVTAAVVSFGPSTPAAPPAPAPDAASATPPTATITTTPASVNAAAPQPINELIDSRMVIAPPPDAPGIAPGTVVQGAGSGFEGITVASALPLFKTDPPRVGLDPPAPGTRAPVNTIDLFTGKPITFSSPKKMHKGYTIAFCCTNSAGYNGGWESLTEAEKDTFVRSFLK